MPRRLSMLLLLAMACGLVHAGNERFIQKQVVVNQTTYRYRVFIPDEWTSKREWPVVLFLHGAGERGSDNARQLSQGLPPWLEKHGKDFPAIVVIPQVPEGTYWTGPVEAAAMQALDDTIRDYHGDWRRLYLTGLSMGGYGSWQIAKDHPDMFAAAAIICGGVLHPRPESPLQVDGVPSGVDPYAWVAKSIGNLPVWIFHGSDDHTVPPEGSRAMHQALLQLHREVRYTEFPGVDHGSWVPAYDLPELWPWMFSHTRPAGG